jgi:hypothetical protein
MSMNAVAVASQLYGSMREAGARMASSTRHILAIAARHLTSSPFMHASAFRLFYLLITFASLLFYLINLIWSELQDIFEGIFRL